MSDVTRRFRAAEGTVPYAQAITLLAEYAREHPSSDYDFGPVGNVRSVVQHGIVVTGPAATVGTLADLLGEQVPGLYEVDA